MGRLDGKVALVTGGARGTGAVTARRFVEEGASVVASDVLDDLGAEEAAKSGATYRPLEVSEASEWAEVVGETVADHGGLDVLVNNAAILDVGAIVDIDPELVKRIVMVNQVGAFLGIQAAIEPMRARGGGSIVNVASIDAIEGLNGVAAYTSSKWGMRGLTKAAALELGRHGIRVNTVCPGAGSSEMSEPFVAKAIEALAERTEPLPNSPVHPFNRSGEMVDVANAILWLAGDEAGFVSGTDLVVDGAFTAGKIEPGAPFS
ncbi:MAG: SDR family NAD(P)-dependent oxidoreductase [Acidimicrobiia bacterium]